MGRKPNSSQAAGPARGRSVLRHVFSAAMLLAFVLLAIVVFQKTEQFLIRDSRLTLPGPADYGEESPNLQLDGVRYASRGRLLGAFAGDYGRSVYLLPLAERRRNLLAVDWVKEASVSRIWPNRVVVRVVEREPVAFVQLSGNAGSRFALIDSEGVLLEPSAPSRFTLPVLTGIRPDQPEAARRERVRRVQHMLKDLSGYSDKVSEIDVADPENLAITLQVQNRAVVLLLGDRRYLHRLKNFLNHYEEIRRRLPGATRLDLRLEDRITAAEGVKAGG